jgi:ABC-2 type transport system ATP-binding protein
MSDQAIVADGLTKIYRSRWTGWTRTACEEISLRVPAGSAYGLLGANGAGKTTFLKMVLSVVQPTRGRSKVFGIDSFRPEARRPIGYLPENHRFPAYMTARTMLDYYAGLSGMKAEARKKRSGELLELVGLTSSADVRLRKYSKGMLQRVGLAQALMHDPRLLVLDEPGDGVDPVGRRQIRDILREQQKNGVTIFINSHLLGEVELFCDRVTILKGGRVTLTGEMQRLTQGKGFTVKANGVSERLHGAVSVHATTHQASVDRSDFLFPDQESANRAIDLLRAEGALILAMTESRSTLEDVFLEAVNESNAGGAR